MAKGHEPVLHWADYLVMATSLLIALGIGIFFAVFKGGQKTREDYLVGGRRMGLGPVSLSLFITFQSAITLIGVPSDIYATGTMVVFFYAGMCLAYLLGIFTAVPVMFPLRLTTVYQYLWLRFRSSALRYLATVPGMLQMIMYMAVALYSPALVLQAVVGLPLWVSLAVVGGVGTVYTAIGGIKSVLWTDVFQTVMMFVGILVILIKGTAFVGGFSALWETGVEGGRVIFDEVDLRARHSLWSTVCGGCVIWLSCLFHQSTVQRISALPSQRHATWCFLLNIPLCLLLGVTMCVMGLLVYAYFHTTGCDPYAAGYIQNKNQVAPYFVLHLFRDTPGMTGLYLAMLFCGSLSTLSSGINSLAANTVEDVLAVPLRHVKDTTITVIAKCIVLGYGLLSVGLAYMLKNASGPVTQISLSVDGALGSPVLGVLFLAAGFPRCNVYGASGGLLVGLLASLTAGIGSTLNGKPTPTLPPASVEHCEVGNGSVVPALPDQVLSLSTASSVGGGFNSTVAGYGVLHTSSEEEVFTFWDLPYFWFAVIGFLTTVIFGIIISLLADWVLKQGTEVDPKLIFPVSRKLFRLPEPKDMKEREGEMKALSTDCHEEKTKDEEGKETSPFMVQGTQPPTA